MPALISRKPQMAVRVSLAGLPNGARQAILPAMHGGGKHPCDPRNLIHEAYRIEGIGPEECRAIFFDWAVGLDAGTDLVNAAKRLHADLGAARPDHPMTALLAEAAHDITPERGRARNRRRRRN